MAIVDGGLRRLRQNRRSTDLVTSIIVLLVFLQAAAVVHDPPSLRKIGGHTLAASDEPSDSETADDPPPRPPFVPGEPPANWPVPDGWKRLSPKDQCWIDVERKQVLVGGNICLTRGTLEMFACPRQTKEHESVVAVDSLVQIVHAALLAVGAQPGHPVRFQPYEPAEGSIVDIEVLWLDEQGKEQRRSAKEMVLNVKTDQALEHDWVFGGSGFWEDPRSTKKRHYQAEAGEFICVSNFSNATLDLPIESSGAAAQLLFKAFTANIPPEDTPVRLLLTPRPPARPQ